MLLEFKMILLDFIFYLMLLIFNLICMAFLTLFERKVLSLVQCRVGPNKVGIYGILQPFSDALKLLTKEFFLIEKSSFFYNLMPLMMFFLSLLIWLIYPNLKLSFVMNFGILLMLCIVSFNVYPIMFGGWISNCNYSLLGGIRAIAQSISYEVSLFLILFSLLLLVEDFSFYNFYIFQEYLCFFIFLFPLYLMFIISMIVELNRAPFDLVEGESELVSGFNIEYFSSGFTLIFMAEYMSILFTSMISTVMFFGCEMMSFSFIIIYMIHIYLIILVRSICPRLRYDYLMDLCWKKFLLISLNYVLLNFVIKELIIFFMI